MPAIAVGAALNLVVVVANRGMPVSESAAAVAGYVGDLSSSLSGVFSHRPLTSETHLPILGDVMPIPGPAVVQSVVSVGDVLLMAGVVAYIASSMCAANPGVADPYVGRHRRQGRPSVFMK